MIDRLKRFAAAALCAAGMAISPALAEPTDVTVRVLAKGAKFIGTSMGGVRIVLRDADTGEILAQGVTQGSTGETQRIMRDGLDRKGVRWTPGAAAFTARLDLDAPLRVRVEATGPMGQPQAAMTVTSEQWVVPGHSITGGDAWLLEMPGFAVDILSPAAHSSASGTIDIKANVVLMCGCGVSPGGLWDADGYEIKAMIYRDDALIDELPMDYAGATSRFEAAYTPEGAGAYRIMVVAYDEENGNTGLDQTTVLMN